jgi:hypothetical protein
MEPVSRTGNRWAGRMVSFLELSVRLQRWSRLVASLLLRCWSRLRQTRMCQKAKHCL